ncbi:MAG: AAA family ATPase [Myxococcota bacterium]|nr:AAA family ATPase [Myxococcota bacterium]
MRFRFRDCVLDADRFELRRAGERVEVQPKVLELLLFLLENRDRTVTKSELLDAVWPGVATGESSLTRAVSFARDALGEPPGRPEMLCTVRGRGYRIGVPVALEEPAEAPPEAAEPGLVCRERELGLARDALLGAMAGRGRVLLLAGEPGIGKTRLAEEIAALAAERGAAVHWGRCYEGEGGPAFWPWVQILRAVLAERGLDGLEAELGPGLPDLAEIVPDVRAGLPELPAAERREPEQARVRLFDGAARLLRAAARTRPLVLLVDDLQSADEPSLRLLEFLAPELGDSPVLLVATYRDVGLAATDPLTRSLAELARSQHRKRTIFLRGLTAGCIRRFVTRVAGFEPSDSVVEKLHQRTEGNPLFLLELLQWLQERDEPWEGAAWDGEVPEGVRQVIGRRLAALPEPCRELLSAAAVIGREFAVGILARVCAQGEDAVLATLAQAERAAVLAPVAGQPGRLRFSHVLFAETLYESLSTAERVRLHRGAGHALEALVAPEALAPSDLAMPIAGEHVSELARHFCEAAVGGDREKAVEYAERAGAQAMASLAFEEARRHYERALAALEAAGRLDTPLGPRLLLGLAEARYRTGDPGGAARELRRCAALARHQRDAAAVAATAFRMSEYKIGGNVLAAVPERIELAEAALDLLPATDSGARARLLAVLGSELFWGDEAERGRALSQQAEQMARRLDDPAALWDVLYRQRLHQFGLAPEARAPLADELFQLARALGDPEREFLARLDLRLAEQLEAAEPDGIERELHACERIAEALRQPGLRWSTLRIRAAQALWQGRLEAGEALMGRARELGRHADRDIADLSHHSTLLVLRRLQGRFAELEPGLRADHRLSLEHGHKRSALALCYAESGRAELASAELAALIGSAGGPRRDSNYVYNLALLAETCAALGDAERGADVYARLAPWAQRYVAIPGVLAAGAAARYLGLLAALARRWDDAEEHFEDALAIEQRMAARPFEAWARRDYGRMLLARGAPGDRRAGREQIDAAERLAREIGIVA